MGEDVAETLEVIPRQRKVIQTVRRGSPAGTAGRSARPRRRSTPVARRRSGVKLDADIKALRELGYRVLEAPDAVACLRLLDEQPDHVDLLFSDLVLPGGVDGVRLASEARQRRPGSYG
jgi:hypothetical protein